ncbi:hypothetical protein HF086_001068, partial [Spodoptera exigua]
DLHEILQSKPHSTECKPNENQNTIDVMINNSCEEAASGKEPALRALNRDNMEPMPSTSFDTGHRNDRDDSLENILSTIFSPSHNMPSPGYVMETQEALNDEDLYGILSGECDHLLNDDGNLKTFSRMKNWRPLTMNDLKTFVGLIIHMGNIKMNRLNDF